MIMSPAEVDDPGKNKLFILWNARVLEELMPGLTRPSLVVSQTADSNLLDGGNPGDELWENSCLVREAVQGHLPVDRGHLGAHGIFYHRQSEPLTPLVTTFV